MAIDEATEIPRGFPKGKRSRRRGGSATSSKKRRKLPNENVSFKYYIFKTLKQVHPEAGISNKAMGIMNSLISDILDGLANEAIWLARYNKKQTISAREIQTATRLFIPGELAKHAVAEGTKSVSRFLHTKSSVQSLVESKGSHKELDGH